MIGKNLWELAKSWGYKEQDYEQIENCWNTVKCELLQKNGEWKRISNETAKKILGATEYLSGCCRSAFHESAVRVGKNNKQVMFEYSWR